MSHRHEAKRFMFRRQPQYIPDLSVVEGPHEHRPETARRGLKINILGGVTDFHVYVTVPALAVLSGSALINTCNDQYCRCL